MAETIYLAVTGNDSTAVHGEIDSPYASLATALSSISAHDTTVIIKDGTYTLTSSDGHLDTSRDAVGYTGDPAGAPRLVHVVRSNVTIQAENDHKAIIDCQNTQGAIWFMTNWADGLYLYSTAGYFNWGGNPSDQAIGDTKVNNITIKGLVVKNFKKSSGKLNFDQSDPTGNGNGANFINVGNGFAATSGAPGTKVTLDKCIFKDSINQSGGGGKVEWNMGFVSPRFQHMDDGARQEEMRYVVPNGPPTGTEGNMYAKSPTSYNPTGSVAIIYTQCLFTNIGADPDDANAGTYGLFDSMGGRQTVRPVANGGVQDLTSLTTSLSVNFINNIFYSTKTGGSQYRYLFRQYVANPHQSSNCYNITNNIFYNLGDPIDLSVQTNANWSVGERGVNNGTTEINMIGAINNIYNNNCIYGINNGTLPDTIEFSTASGNLIDTNPQLLSPEDNRWGLRQDSPCDVAGVNNPVIFGL